MVGNGPMARDVAPRGVRCPHCSMGLEPIDRGDAAPAEHRMVCPDCGEYFRVRRRDAGVEVAASQPASEPPPVGSLSLIHRGMALALVEVTYRVGVVLGVLVLLSFGKIVPICRAWLRDEINSWADIVESLGGVHVVTETKDPDADLGPVLDRSDAPLLFNAVNEVSKRLGVKPPGQIRLTYLPCCGMVAWRGSQALILGLPLLRVLNHSELRAILAHELAHLARGDATRAARSSRFVEGLRQALDRAGGAERGFLGALARWALRDSTRLIGPIARGQEARADRCSAAIAGGGAAASALVKVAMVQPLFREVLEIYDPTASDAPNLYAFFRAFWFRLPAEVHTAMRLRILTNTEANPDPAPPPLPDRLALIHAYPDPVNVPSFNENGPVTALLSDLEAFEEMLHNRLFALPLVEPSVFHKAGT